MVDEAAAGVLCTPSTGDRRPSGTPAPSGALLSATTGPLLLDLVVDVVVDVVVVVVGAFNYVKPENCGAVEMVRGVAINCH
jgi:hypothetical protein